MNRVSQFGDEEGAATGQAEESAGAPESSAREGGYSMQDLEDIWNNVADRISGDRPALSAATNGVVLTGISDDQFRLQVEDAVHEEGGVIGPQALAEYVRHWRESGGELSLRAARRLAGRILRSREG